MNQNDTMTPQEHAELVRDARELVAAVERAVRRTGAVFVATMGLTVAATALGLDPVASVASVVAVAAFAAALILLMARIALGAAPEPLDDAAAEIARRAFGGTVEAPANGSGRPATGSGPATPENGVIPPK